MEALTDKARREGDRDACYRARAVEVVRLAMTTATPADTMMSLFLDHIDSFRRRLGEDGSLLNAMLLGRHLFDAAGEFFSPRDLSRLRDICDLLVDGPDVASTKEN